jgi:hypothetical protein
MPANSNSNRGEAQGAALDTPPGLGAKPSDILERLRGFVGSECEHPLNLHRRFNSTIRFSNAESSSASQDRRWICFCIHFETDGAWYVGHVTLHPRAEG